jgi:hypothetical protein
MYREPKQQNITANCHAGATARNKDMDSYYHCRLSDDCLQKTTAHMRRHGHM